MTHPPRLADIAQAVGVSSATVSRVLNDSRHNRVSPATRQAILKAAADLGYAPNVAAQTLSRGTAPILGVVVPGIQSQHFPRLIAGVEAVAFEAGFQTIVTTAGRMRAEGHARAVRALAAHHVSGLIICPRDEPESDQALADALAAASTPAVVVDRPLPGVCLPSVLPDNRGGGRLAGEILVRDECEPLVFVANSSRYVRSIWQERLAGMREAAEAAGRQVEVCFLDAADAGARLSHLADANRPGLFLNTFFDLPKLVRALGEAGLCLPSAARICGFDEGQWGLDDRAVHALLISLEQWPAFITYSEFDLGKAVAEMLLRRIREGEWSGESVLFPVGVGTSR